jgi:hypothetical protein
MRCVQCFLVVSATCPICKDVLQRAKDAVELLSRRAVLVINVEDFPLPGALQHFSWDPQRGMAYNPAAVPQFVCLVNDGGKWFLAYRHPIASAEQLHELRRYFEAKAHWLKVTAGRVCYETRGRRRKEESEGEAQASGSRRRRR